MDNNVSQELYKYISAETAMRILDANTLQYSSPLTYNDPFDVPRSMLPNSDGSELSMSIILKLIENNHTSTNKDGPLQKISLMIQNYDFKEFILGQIDNNDFSNSDSILNEQKIHWEKDIKRMRILCLSETNDNIPMWFHYADRYKGVVLEFENLDSFKKVNYVNNRHCWHDINFWVDYILSTEPNKTEKLYELAIFQKHEDWSYEKEHRSVCWRDNQSLYDYKIFDKNKLKSVFLGPKIGDDEQSRLISLLKTKYERTKIYNTIMDFDIKFIQLKE